VNSLKRRIVADFYNAKMSIQSKMKKNCKKYIQIFLCTLLTFSLIKPVVAFEKEKPSKLNVIFISIEDFNLNQVYLLMANSTHA